MGTQVVICEDDARLRTLLRRGLTDAGFDVVLTAGTGRELLDGALERSGAVLLVADIGLPDADGRDVVAALRARGLRLGVLLLTARENVVDRISGFHAGADDYMPKPFAFAELVVRLEALARRARTDDADAAVVGLRLDPGSHAVAMGERKATLTPTEYRILARLLAEPGQVVRRHRLVAAGWPDGAMVNDNTLDAYVARLRRKLRDLDANVDLTTMRGVGYRVDRCADD